MIDECSIRLKKAKRTGLLPIQPTGTDPTLLYSSSCRAFGMDWLFFVPGRHTSCWVSLRIYFTYCMYCFEIVQIPDHLDLKGPPCPQSV